VKLKNVVNGNVTVTTESEGSFVIYKKNKPLDGFCKLRVNTKWTVCPSFRTVQDKGLCLCVGETG